MMNLQQIIKTSRIFYRDHHLPAWREALPKKVELEDEVATLEQCAKEWLHARLRLSAHRLADGDDGVAHRGNRP